MWQAITLNSSCTAGLMTVGVMHPTLDRNSEGYFSLSKLSPCALLNARYRAPECLLTDGFYDHKMDMWSVGCVMFEAMW